MHDEFKELYEKLLTEFIEKQVRAAGPVTRRRSPIWGARGCGWSSRFIARARITREYERDTSGAGSIVVDLAKTRRHHRPAEAARTANGAPEGAPSHSGGTPREPEARVGLAFV